MSEKIESLIRSLPLWKENIKISKIDGGLTNQNFMVEENKKKFVVRMGEDIPEHLISRSNELIVSRAASAVGLSPGIAYHDKGILILEYIKSKTFTDEDVRKNIKSIIPLIKKIHYEIPKKLFGQSLIFWVFHVIRNYINFLSNNESSYSKILLDLMKKSEILEIK